MAQKYRILIEGTVIESGYYSITDEAMLKNKVDFLKRRVKDGVIVELITWCPNR
jgi:hypothetical protein